MDKNSKLDATATGHSAGPGYDWDLSGGGSFGGQGGSALDDQNLKPNTYGTFDQVITKDDWQDLTNFLGSGGHIGGSQHETTRGGGAIYMSTKLYQILG